jgi:hypothetical protein
LPLTHEAIVELLDRMESEVKAIQKEIIKFCWHMRGGLTYDEAMQLSREERILIGELIKENLDITKTTKLPYF